MSFRKYTALEVNIVSAKAYEALYKSNELTTADETAHSPKQKNDVDEKERKKRLKGSLIKFGSLAVFAFVVWIFATIAWFSSNTSVSGSGMGVSVAGIPFELSSTGKVPSEYLSLYRLADSNYDEGAIIGAESSGVSEHRTGTVNKLIMRLDSGNDGSSYTEGFRPGASGVLNFDIIPYTDDELYVKCNFNLRTFDATYDDDTGATTSITEITDNSPDDLQNASNYLRGHILFFTDRTISDGNEIYSGYIGTDGYTKHIEAGNSGEKINVIIYWKWVNTFDQMILKVGDTSRTDYPLLEDDNADDRAALISYINSNYQNILAEISNTNASFMSTATYTTIKSNATRLNELNENYNTADQLIGVNIDYFLLDISAEKTTAPVSTP